MRAAKNYWVASTRPDGRPHVAPTWAVWHEDRLYFDGSPETRRMQNIAANPNIAVHLEDGMQAVIVEGSRGRPACRRGNWRRRWPGCMAPSTRRMATRRRRIPGTRRAVRDGADAGAGVDGVRGRHDAVAGATSRVSGSARKSQFETKLKQRAVPFPRLKDPDGTPAKLTKSLRDSENAAGCTRPVLSPGRAGHPLGAASPGQFIAGRLSASGAAARRYATESGTSSLQDRGG